MTIQELIDELSALGERDRVVYVQTKDDGLDFPEVIEGFLDLEDEEGYDCIILMPSHEHE
jgi:hypothetical protein